MAQESITGFNIQNPLSKAILDGNQESFNQLIQVGSGLVNQYDHNKETPLHLAARLAGEYEAAGKVEESKVVQEMAHRLVTEGGASMDIENGKGEVIARVEDGDELTVKKEDSSNSSFSFSSTSSFIAEADKQSGGDVDSPKLTESSFNQDSDSLHPDVVKELLSIPRDSEEEMQTGGGRSSVQNLTTTTISTPYSNDFSSLSFESISPSLNLGGASISSKRSKKSSKKSKKTTGGSVSKSEWNKLVNYVARKKDIAPSKARGIASKLAKRAKKKTKQATINKEVAKVARSLL